MKQLMLVVLVVAMMWCFAFSAQAAQTNQAQTGNWFGQGKTLSQECQQKIAGICKARVCFTAQSNFMSPLGLFRYNYFRQYGIWLDYSEARKMCTQANTEPYRENPPTK